MNSQSKCYGKCHSVGVRIFSKVMLLRMFLTSEINIFVVTRESIEKMASLTNL